MPGKALNMYELFSSPLSVLVLARSIIEVGGAPPAMLWGENLELYTAEDLVSCLRALSLRVPGHGYFDQPSAERLSELIVQCEQDFTPFHEDYQWQADILLALGLALRPFAAPFLSAPGTATWFTDLDRQLQEWMSSTGPPQEIGRAHV